MLEISELYQRFGDRVAVDKLSLAVKEGEIVGLVGRNGAGKTTTMRAVMGIFRPLGPETVRLVFEGVPHYPFREQVC